jgi:FkbM family methyltransferase
MVEPLEERRASLQSLKEMHPNVDYILAGAADQPGRLTLGVTQGLFDSSFAYGGSEERVVDVATIDGLLHSGRIEQPQFMKLDVQGFEIRVLEGASEAMRNCDAVMIEQPFFRFCESMTLVHESIAWMAARGFLPYEIVDILRRPLDGAMGQCDILFVRQGHKLVQDIRWA